MKKITYLLTMLFLGFQVNIQAQSDIRFGFQISPNLTWLSSNDNTINGDGSNIGLRLGVMGEYYFTERYAFTGGLGFSFGQGGFLKHDVGGNFLKESEISEILKSGEGPLPDGVRIGYKIQYIEIPIGLKMRTDEIGYFRYFAEIPIFNLSIRSQSRGTISGDGIDETDLDINKDVTPINLGWGLGGGVEYSITSNAVLVAGLYYQSNFIDITDNSANKAINLIDAGLPDDRTDDIYESTPSEDSRVNIGSITLRIGVLF